MVKIFMDYTFCVCLFLIEIYPHILRLKQKKVLPFLVNAIHKTMECSSTKYSIFRNGGYVYITPDFYLELYMEF